MIFKIGVLSCVTFVALSAFAAELRITTFNVDATPPVGSALGGGSVPPMRGVDDPLSARGVVLLPAGQRPIVLCAVDWIGIANDGHAAWREALADAVDTDVERVTVHVLHQHDAPFVDFSVETLMAEQGLSGRMFDVAFARDVIDRVAEAARDAIRDAVPVTHVGLGKAKVEKVASNRRILGEDGRVAQVRWTATADPALRAEPVGTIDPWMRAVSFWNGDEPVAILTHYATHPQSYYRMGMVSTDFPGLARAQRETDLPGVAHIHFNGAGGNIGAGKYNDGDPKNRPVLAGRMQAGMKRAFDASERHAIAGMDIAWDVRDVALPLRSEIDYENEEAVLANTEADLAARMGAAREIAWIDRCRAGTPITIGRLRMGPMQLVYMPGELFVEYQLAAQAIAPDDFVGMAAYGDYGPGYIGTEIAYGEGGYETGLRTSRTAPSVESVLMNALEALLAR